jgi:hypothetical protein
MCALAAMNDGMGEKNEMDEMIVRALSVCLRIVVVSRNMPQFFLFPRRTRIYKQKKKKKK